MLAEPEEMRRVIAFKNWRAYAGTGWSEFLDSA